MGHSFLLELGLEEMPADVISPALAELGRNLTEVLAQEGVSPDSVRSYGTPRRLALLAEGLPERQPGREELILGPPVRVALGPDGGPGRAAYGFARSRNLNVELLERIETPKGEYLGFRKMMPGRSLPEILQEKTPQLVAGLPWPRSMYWRESRFRFIRPLRWCTALWDSEIVSFRFEGIDSGRITRGHRFLGEGEIRLAHAAEYPDQMRRNYVLASVDERRSKISQELADRVPAGLSPVEDERLLETVVQLNEYPTALCGDFDEAFLSIPREVLVTVMRHHQKYFSVADAGGRLRAHFLTVVNTDGDSDGRIRKGHERVLRARLEDAAFFWRTDLKTSMEARSESLAEVVFHQRLGSYLDKVKRVQALCSRLKPDPRLELAALLSKADLTSEMVRELPELQGVMGGLYARREGYPAQVWKAILEHYKPVSLSDAPPSTLAGALLALADKLDTVTACISGGIVPTGSSDPFALRRQALGVVKILLEYRLDYPLEDLVRMARRSLPDDAAGMDSEGLVLAFLERRVRHVFLNRGVSEDVIRAVQAVDSRRSLHLRLRKAAALEEMRNEADFEVLATAFKRIKNILAGQAIELDRVRVGELREPAERTLHRVVQETRPQVAARLEQGEFLEALKQMARLRGPVDRFFEDVLVMSHEKDLRRNRLRILHEISQLFLSYADISMVART